MEITNVSIHAASADILNVSDSVGVNGVNNRVDVYLVQILLNEVYEVYPRARPTITGGCDQKTLDAIKIFQEEKHSANWKIKSESTIFKAEKLGTSVKGKVTIIALNHSMGYLLRVKGDKRSIVDYVKEKYGDSLGWFRT